MKYFSERINDDDKRPGATSNAAHVIPMPKPPKGASELAIVKRGGRFTPGRVKQPVNSKRKEQFNQQQ